MILQRIGNRGINLGTFFDRAAAAHPSNTIAFDHDLPLAPQLGRQATVVQAADAVARIADQLRAVGVGPGDKAVVHKSNAFDVTLAACAIVRAGATPILLSPKLDGETVKALLRRISTARFPGLSPDLPVLLTDAAKLTGELEGDEVFALAKAVLVPSGPHPRAIALLDQAVPAERGAAEAFGLHQPTLVTHTSGTTGLPKLAVHTNFTLQARFRPQFWATRLVPARQPLVMHVSFVHSRLFTFVPISLLRGFPLVVLADDDPKAAAELFLAHRPVGLEAHPNTFMLWEELADDPRKPLSSVKYYSSTFDAIHPRTVRRLLGASAHKRPLFVQLYGQSEIGPSVFSWFTKKSVSEDGGRFVGFPFPGMTDSRVVARGGRKPTKENPGFIEIRSDGRVKTYLGEDERYDKQVSPDGWWRMGDVGYKDQRGALYLLDREVDLIEGFGSTLEAEDKLFALFDELTEVIIVPGPSGKALPVVCTKDDRPLDARRWELAVRSLPPMDPPLHCKLEELPQTATTKIKRLELARALADRGV